MGGGTSRLDETDWENADGQGLLLDADTAALLQTTIDGMLPTATYQQYELQKRTVGQREFDVIDAADKTLHYTTKAVPGTVSWFDVLGPGSCGNYNDYKLRVHADLARRTWIVYRYHLPVFEGQRPANAADQQEHSNTIQHNSNNKLDEKDKVMKGVEEGVLLYRTACITVSWSRYIAVAARYGPPDMNDFLDVAFDVPDNDNDDDDGDYNGNEGGIDEGAEEFDGQGDDDDDGNELDRLQQQSALQAQSPDAETSNNNAFSPSPTTSPSKSSLSSSPRHKIIKKQGSLSDDPLFAQANEIAARTRTRRRAQSHDDNGSSSHDGNKEEVVNGGNTVRGDNGDDANEDQVNGTAGADSGEKTGKDCSAATTSDVTVQDDNEHTPPPAPPPTASPTESASSRTDNNNDVDIAIKASGSSNSDNTGRPLYGSATSRPKTKTIASVSTASTKMMPATTLTTSVTAAAAAAAAAAASASSSSKLGGGGNSSARMSSRRLRDYFRSSSSTTATAAGRSAKFDNMPSSRRFFGKNSPSSSSSSQGIQYNRSGSTDGSNDLGDGIHDPDEMDNDEQLREQEEQEERQAALTRKFQYELALEGVIDLDTQPILQCQEIYNKMIGNHQTFLMTKEQVIKLLQMDEAQHEQQQQEGQGEGSGADLAENDNDDEFNPMVQAIEMDAQHHSGDQGWQQQEMTPRQRRRSKWMARFDSLRSGSGNHRGDNANINGNSDNPTRPDGAPAPNEFEASLQGIVQKKQQAAPSEGDGGSTSRLRSSWHRFFSSSSVLGGTNGYVASNNGRPPSADSPAASKDEGVEVEYSGQEEPAGEAPDMVPARDTEELLQTDVEPQSPPLKESPLTPQSTVIADKDTLPSLLDDSASSSMNLDGNTLATEEESLMEAAEAEAKASTAAAATSMTTKRSPGTPGSVGSTPGGGVEESKEEAPDEEENEDTPGAPGFGVEESKEAIQDDVDDRGNDNDQPVADGAEIPPQQQQCDKEEEEAEEQPPLVGYWAWKHTTMNFSQHKMLLHLAKNSDLALHVVLAIIVNQVRSERNHTIFATTGLHPAWFFIDPKNPKAMIN